MSKLKSSRKYQQSDDETTEASESRIITKNLVYVIGISKSLASKEILEKPEYFGQYGSIVKLVVNKKKAYNLNHPCGPSYSAYVTYTKAEEASIAILSLDNTIIDNHLIRASFGTTKYCSFYLKRMECTNRDCLFLHKKANENDIIKREDLNVNKNIFYEQQLYAIKIADVYNPLVKKRILKATKVSNAIFPTPDQIYQNEIVIQNQPRQYQPKAIKIIKKKDVESIISPANSKKKIVNKSSTEKVAKISSDKQTILSPESAKSRNQSKSKKSIRVNSLNSLEIEIKLRSNNSTTTRDDGTCPSTSTGEDLLSSKEKEDLSFLTDRTKSRFDFVDSSKVLEESNVPSFVTDFVDQRIQMDILSKRIPNIDQILAQQILDKISKEKKTKKEKEWNKFFNQIAKGQRITKPKHQRQDEMEKISNFIIKKVNNEI